MSNLKTFLETASENHEQALIEARQHPVNEGRLIPATTMNQLLASFGLLEPMWDIQADKNHPNAAARSSCIAVLLSIQGNHEFNFIHGTVAGEGNKALLSQMIEVTMTEYAQQLIQFRATVLALANKTTYPFANVTLHDVLVARDAVEDFKLLESPDGWVSIEVSTECETHNPRLQAFNPHNEQWVPAGVFRGVGAVGKYVTQVPRNVFGWNLRVDDIYGAFV